MRRQQGKRDRYADNKKKIYLKNAEARAIWTALTRKGVVISDLFETWLVRTFSEKLSVEERIVLLKEQMYALQEKKNAEFRASDEYYSRQLILLQQKIDELRLQQEELSRVNAH